jgi:hypothetical protein
MPNAEAFFDRNDWFHESAVSHHRSGVPPHLFFARGDHRLSDEIDMMIGGMMIRGPRRDPHPVAHPPAEDRSSILFLPPSISLAPGAFAVQCELCECLHKSKVCRCTEFRKVVEREQFHQLTQESSSPSSNRRVANGRSRDAAAAASSGQRNAVTEAAKTAGETRRRAESRGADQENGSSRVQNPSCSLQEKLRAQDLECIPLDDEGEDVDALVSEKPRVEKPGVKTDKSKRRRPRDVSPARERKREEGMKGAEASEERVAFADQDRREQKRPYSLLSTVGKGLQVASWRE